MIEVFKPDSHIVVVRYSLLKFAFLDVSQCAINLFNSVNARDVRVPLAGQVACEISPTFLNTQVSLFTAYKLPQNILDGLGYIAHGCILIRG
jgi:hypothetical protein